MKFKLCGINKVSVYSYSKTESEKKLRKKHNNDMQNSRNSNEHISKPIPQIDLEDWLY